MFEKEAEEYGKPFYNMTRYDYVEERTHVKKAFQKGAEFGYDKANEWHFVENGDLPKKSILVLAYFENMSLAECLYIPDEGFKHPIFSEWFEPVAWIEKEKVLPKE